MSKNSEIVIVGAGPVGLWSAIQLLQRRPHLNVTLYERHETYQRSHVLRLLALSTVLYSKSTSTERKDQFYKEILGKDLSKIFMHAATGSVFIRTNDLEAALKSYALDLGAKIKHERVTSPETLMAAHPDCKIFIAADGAKSPMRNALLGPDEQAIDTTPLQYIAELKYQAEGKAGKLDFLDAQIKTNKLLSHAVFEYVGRVKEDRTPVSLRFFLDKKTYDAIPSATFAEPLRLYDERLAQLVPALVADARIYMNARKEHANENYLDGSAALTKLTLSAYVANRWAVEAEGRSWFFVGDSAMGVPYFRALNAGFFIGSQLGTILTRDWLSDQNKRRAYNAARPLDKLWEFTTAHGKNQILQAYDAFRQASAASPLEIVAWGREEVDGICNQPHKAFAPQAEPKL